MFASSKAGAAAGEVSLDGACSEADLHGPAIASYLRLALEHLGSIVQDTRLGSTLLHLQMQVRAAADQLVQQETSRRCKRGVRLCCCMFLACVMHTAATRPVLAASLELNQRRRRAVMLSRIALYHRHKSP